MTYASKRNLSLAVSNVAMTIITILLIGFAVYIGFSKMDAQIQREQV